MTRLSKATASLLIIIAACSCLSLLSMKPANAQSTPKPTVPEFTLRYVDHSYDVPPITTSTTDPYTGKVTTATISGYHVENKSVQVIITNPSFQSYKDENGSNINLYYDVVFKGHFAQTWNSISQSALKSYYMYVEDSPTTILSAPIYNVSDGGQIDVEVRALIGKFIEVYAPPFPPLMDVTGITYKFVGQAGDWSNTQTIRIPVGAISISAPSFTNDTAPIPTATPTVPELSSLAVLPLLLSVFVVAFVLRHRKTADLR
jgi:hypothetical protein